MWKYRSQIIIRWVMSLLLSFVAAYAIYSALQSFPDLSLKMSIEAAVTNLSVTIEYIPIWGWPIVFFASVFMLVLGFPSSFLFALCYIFSNFWIAATIGVFAQTLASLITIFMVRRFGWSDNLPKHVETMIVSSNVLVGDFTFWARLFISYPQRTLDVVTAKLMPKEMRYFRLAFQIIPSLALRMTIPSIWVVTFVNFIYRITPFPKQSTTNFLFASSILVVFVLLPKIPELMPCPSNVKTLLRVLISNNEEPSDEPNSFAEDDNNNENSEKQPIDRAVSAISESSQI